MDSDSKNTRPEASSPAPKGGADDARRVLVGRFGAAHGVRGEIRLQSFTQNPGSIGKFKPLTDAAGVRVFVLKALRPQRDNLFIAQVQGCEDRNAAEALTNAELYFERAKFPKAAKDEFYVADLIGLAAVRDDGEAMGVVIDIANYGAGDLLEIRPPHGDTILIPFTRANVPEIDFDARRVVVCPPPEIEAKEED